MAHQLTNQLGGGTLLSRRALFGLVIAAGVIAPLVVGAGAAHAEDDPEEEEYEIPDDIGSSPWW